jgi:hypothetical protein
MAEDKTFGAAAYRELGDGRALWVYRMIYTYKLVIGQIGAAGFDNSWCYKNLASATYAFLTWNPLVEAEPTGWVRHPHSGRRRFPDGDPTTEETRPMKYVET